MDVETFNQSGGNKKITNLFNGLAKQKKLDDNQILHEVLNADENTIPSLMVGLNHQDASTV